MLRGHNEYGRALDLSLDKTRPGLARPVPFSTKRDTFYIPVFDYSFFSFAHILCSEFFDNITPQRAGKTGKLTGAPGR